MKVNIENWPPTFNAPKSELADNVIMPISKIIDWSRLFYYTKNYLHLDQLESLNNIILLTRLQWSSIIKENWTNSVTPFLSVFSEVRNQSVLAACNWIFPRAYIYLPLSVTSQSLTMPSLLTVRFTTRVLRNDKHAHAHAPIFGFCYIIC